MKISCTVSEFAKMIRSCKNASCYECAFGDICDDERGLERFISAADITDDPEDEET